ncbi:hypothetical protein LRS13_19945 [Svornostia abyssi]|uniref:Glycosyltransferase RgtA/B/C/D-like domain-containing protein n=1 Tax=Svornostia abyssi TaxID=2898438 RepID=A0ABY5PE33_9ACTN|nr:hypothetical protein LRS13_19945 [Parviterribacteraceae bacterium J379]
MPIRTSQAAWVAGLVGVGVLAAVLYGPGYLGYDAAWGLVWGAELADGGLPSYEAALAPTPHPLVNVAAAVIAVMSGDGEPVLVALSFAAFAVLVGGAWQLGAELAGSWRGGPGAAVLVGSVPLLAREVAFASVDIPFLALVVWALVLLVRAGGPTLGPLWLLSAAGLLRPEAWVLAGAFVAWMAADGRAGRTGLLRAAGLALAAPVLWALSDLVITGTPLHSLQGTRALADTLDRPQGFGSALSALVPRLAATAGIAVVAAGACGAAALWLRGVRMVLPVLGAAVVALVTFLALGAAGLPVLDRYLLLPAVLLACLAGAGAGQISLRRMETGRPAQGLAIAAGVLAVVAVISAVQPIRDARRFTAAREQVHRELRDVAGRAAMRRAVASCDAPLRVPDFRTRPVVLLDVPLAPEDVVVGNLADGVPGTLLTYADDRAALIFNLGAPGEVRRQAAPAGAVLIGENASWRAFSAC